MCFNVVKMTNTEKKKSRSRHQATGQWIRSDKRLAIYLRDRFTCLYCLADLHDVDPNDITLDHVIPKADKGTNSEKNLVTCCKSCNSSRQDKPLNRFVGKEAIAHIRRNTRRNLRKYRVLAKEILNQKFNHENENF